MIYGTQSKNMSQNQNNKPQHNNVVMQKAEMFSGPVPHPEIIEKYEKIYPGAAKIIFDQWEGQTKHRQNLERAVIETDNRKSMLGVVFGFIIVLIAIVAGVYTAIKGHPLFGSGLSVAGLALLVSAFITSKKKEDTNNSK